MLLAQAESFFMISIFCAWREIFRNEFFFFANDSWWISFRWRNDKSGWGGGEGWKVFLSTSSFGGKIVFPTKFSILSAEAFVLNFEMR